MHIPPHQQTGDFDEWECCSGERSTIPHYRFTMPTDSRVPATQKWTLLEQAHEWERRAMGELEGYFANRNSALTAADAPRPA